MSCTTTRLPLVAYESVSSSDEDSDRKQAHIGLVWFKNSDLRIHDHAALLNAHRQCDEVIHLMVVDPFWFTEKTRLLAINKTGPFRCNFLREAIHDLRSTLRSLGSELIVRFGDSADIIPSIIDEFGVDSVHYHDEIHSDERSVVNKVVSKVNQQEQSLSEAARTQFVSYWGGNTLCDPSDLPWDSVSQIPDTFSQFLKAMADILPNKPLDTLTAAHCRPHPAFVDIGVIPSLKQLGCDRDHIALDPRTQFPFKGGETAGLQRLRHFVWGQDGSGGMVSVYNETRDQSIGSEYSTKFSPFLAHGNLSSRTIYAAVKEFEAKTGIANKSTYWVYWELLCRDFFRFSSLKYGDRIFYLNGPWGKSLYPVFAAPDWEWKSDRVLFQKWCDGQTGYPLIDAAMIELKATGFMSNRMRQNTANFLVKDMGIDWRWGAEWFESLLLDYDAAQNYCNWNYIAGVGFNVVAGRYFNIMKQAQTFDAEGEFVKLWIPKLEDCPSEFIHRPFALTEDQREEFNAAYPAPCCPLNPPPSKKKKFAAQQSARGTGKKRQRKSKKERRRERMLRHQQRENAMMSSESSSSDSAQPSL